MFANSVISQAGAFDPLYSWYHFDWSLLYYFYFKKVAVHNAVPFVGFGFLDNFIMIIAGDYIELSLGSVITISTMAAAALGNTISDVMGIGSAWYVELIACKIGLKAPDLSPIQLDMKSARRFANLGRAIGIVIGCLLGMIPLLFMTTESSKDKTLEAAAAK